ncbi:hypothetical protein R3W88_027292 [Solanum pinnatisectum]|uniref:Uncharacterized protein n=1 Tax=Solanum pinnatisectum TaxID=50273 RepID=A0AAV9LGW4_9SOLN|nr:hypothetical protein R3W88_027292 [Solanum pinnatisectum]
MLDICFDRVAREGDISLRQHISGSNKSKKKTHGRQHSWDGKMTEDMNYQVLLDRFEEEDKRKILQVTFDGQLIFFNSCICNRKFEADKSTFFLIGIFLHYLSILICNIIMECITNSVVIRKYLVLSSSYFLHAC